MKQLKTLLPILKEFTVRVDEKMRVLSKPVPEGGLYREEAYRISLDEYNNALELVQMPRVMEFDYAAKDYWCCHERFRMGENLDERNVEIIDSTYKYKDFAKLPPKLEYYIPCYEGKNEVMPKWSKSDENEPWFDEYKTAFETALSKTIFYGWELFQDTDQYGISIYCGNNIISFRPNGIIQCNNINIVAQEDAFIHCSHYIELNKLS